MACTTVTVVFTDMVGSTALLARRGAQAHEVRRAHFAALRGSVVAHRGREVKNLGDGLLVTFTSAGEALGCAVSMQQAIARLSRQDPHEIRIGISAGDCVVDDDGDVFGQAVVEAARLCETAKGGQILVADVALALVGDAQEHDAVGLGPSCCGASRAPWR